MRSFLPVLLVCAAGVFAQPAPPAPPPPVQPGQQPPKPGQTNQPEEVIFRSGTQLVVRTVAVKDKKGQPIEGLKAKDFIVTEDGVPQNIAFLEFQKLEENVVPLPPTGPALPVPRLAKATIAPEKPGDLKYTDRR